MMTKIKTSREIQAMRDGGRMLATVLQLVKRHTQDGISTKALANLAGHELKKLGGKPAFYGYYGFPDVMCVSINNEIVHGIPKQLRTIKEGDIVSLDFGVLYEGMITDGAISFVFGKGAPENHKLVERTEQAMYAGIDVVKNGCKTGDIGNAVEKKLSSFHYGIVRDLVGHGVGHELHEDPNVPNYGHPHTGKTLHSGMTIAIEPMATLGKHEVTVLEDGWTVVTRDNSWAAHFEHTILITEQGSEVLTAL